MEMILKDMDARYLNKILGIKDLVIIVQNLKLAIYIHGLVGRRKIAESFFIWPQKLYPSQPSFFDPTPSH